MLDLLWAIVLWSCYLLRRVQALTPQEGACAALTSAGLDVEGTNTISISAVEETNFSVPATPPFLSTSITNLAVCQVVVTYNHDDAPSPVNLTLYLPLTDWNGRFLGVGGSGYVAGIPITMAPYAQQGYATASTDAGLPGGGDPTTVANWALLPDGSVNSELLENFGSRSVHDLAVIGKSVVSHFYGEEQIRTYWIGCSQGGRQGLMAAQKHPADFDGIVSGARAHYWTQYVVAEHWPQAVMKDLQTWPSNCVLDFITSRAVEACDPLDDVADGVISDVQLCREVFDPSASIGVEVPCGKESYIVDTKTAEDGKTIGLPFVVEDDWIKYFVKRDPNYKTTEIGLDEMLHLFDTSFATFDDIIGASDPDLRKFQEGGSKLIGWHGEADQLIFPQDSTKYFREVDGFLRQNGHTWTHSNADTIDFFRLFPAPGVDHCAASGLAPGAAPLDPLSAIVAWVEADQASDYLPAGFHGQTKAVRKLCPYPQRAVYLENGAVDNVDRWGCR